MGNPLADRTRVAGLTMADGTWVAIHSLGAGVVSIAMYGPTDGSADENATVQPDVVLGLSEQEAQVLADAISLASTLSHSDLRPNLRLVKGTGDRTMKV
jgi:hypothetical protein